MRSRFAFVLASLATAAGCGANHYKREVVGAGGGVIALRGDTAPPATTIQLGRGSYDLALSFDVPRAQVVEYELSCPGLFARKGSVGETFEQYRARRIAQLNQMAARDRQAMSAVVGAVAPNLGVRGQAQSTQVTPAGTATTTTTVDAQVSGQAAGTAVAQEAFPEIRELPPGDVGRGRLDARMNVTLGEEATCSLLAYADDANVLVGYQLTHIRNLKQEAQEKRIAANEAAAGVRVQLTAQLEANGADPLALQKKREAEARASAEAADRRRREQAIADAERMRKEAERLRVQAELDATLQVQRDAERAERDAERARRDAELEAQRAREKMERDAERQRIAAERERVRLEVSAKLELEAKLKLEVEIRRKRQIAETRTLLVAYLASECHADPNKRQREREELAIKIKLEMELKAKLELQAKLERDRRQAELDARIAADAEREGRLRAERNAREAKIRAEREARLQFEAEQRAAVEAKLAFEREQRAAAELGAQPQPDAAEQVRVAAALSIRANLRAQLISYGARERPPMPALIVENPGTQPFDGAVWITGSWSWTAGQWVWSAGGWQDQSTFGESGHAGGAVVTRTVTSTSSSSYSSSSSSSTTANGGVSVSIPTSVGVSVGGVSVGAGVSGSGTASSSGGATVRDHRTNQPPATNSGGPTVRDHRRR